MPTAFSPHIGDQEYMPEKHRLTPEAIAKTAENAILQVVSRLSL